MLTTSNNKNTIYITDSEKEDSDCGSTFSKKSNSEGDIKPKSTDSGYKTSAEKDNIETFILIKPTKEKEEKKEVKLSIFDCVQSMGYAISSPLSKAEIKLKKPYKFKVKRNQTVI